MPQVKDQIDCTTPKDHSGKADEGEGEIGKEGTSQMLVQAGPEHVWA